MHLRLEKILAQTAALKEPEWPSYGNSRKVTQNPHFLKKCKGGTKENFSKIAQKGALALKAQKHSGASGANGENSGPKRARTTKLWQFWQGHPKPAFSKKVQRRVPRKFFKNRPKSSPRLKGPKALWRKWHYPRTSMHLKCKNWRVFWRKQGLQKCPNGQVATIFARSTVAFA